jgi:hypothetical protein
LLGHGLRFSARIGPAIAVYEMRARKEMEGGRSHSLGRKMEWQRGRVETKGLAIHAGVS